MLRTLIKKEFLNHLLSFRFQVSALICLLLMILSVVVLRGEFIDRAKTYGDRSRALLGTVCIDRCAGKLEIILKFVPVPAS